MLDSRRAFLVSIAGASAWLAMGPGGAAGQRKWPKPPEAAQPPEKDAPLNARPSRAVLEANGREIKKNVQQLYDLVSAMKSEVDQTDPADVLSVRLYKQAQEIEKLAKQIKNRARG